MRRAEHLQPLNIHAGKRRTLFNFFLFSTLIAAPLLFLALYFGGSKYSVFITAFVIKQIIFLYPLIRVRQFDYFEPVIFAILLSPLGDYRILHLLLYEDFYPDFSPGISQAEAIDLGTHVMVYQAAGFVSLYFGYYTRFGQKLASKLPVPSDRPWNKSRLFLVIAVMSAIAAACYLYITVSLAGDPLTYASFAKSYRRLLNPYTFFLRGVELVSAASMIWYVYHLTQKKTVLFWVYFIGTNIILLTFASRSMVIFPCFVLLVLHHYLKKPLQAWKLAAFVVVVILFAVVAQDVRQTATFDHRYGLSFRAAADREYKPEEVLSDWIEDRRGFDTFVELVRRVPDEIDLQYGKSYAYFAVMPVPRFIWPGKHDFLHKEVITEATVVQAQQPPGFVMGLYLNFHVPGIVLGCFLWGICLKLLYQWFKSNKDNRTVVIFYVVLLAYMGAGPTTIAVSSTVTFIVPIAIILRVLQVRKQEPAARAR